MSSSTTLKAVLIGEDRSMGRTFDNVGRKAEGAAAGAVIDDDRVGRHQDALGERRGGGAGEGDEQRADGESRHQRMVTVKVMVPV